jgi:peroxiredoxin
LASLVSGCGDGAGENSGAVATSNSADAPVKTAETSSSKIASSAGITASIDSPEKSLIDKAEDSESQSSSNTSVASIDEAATTLREIQQLRISAVPADLNEAKAARRDRNERIIDMATRVIRLTMDDDTRKAQFHQAIGQLLEARFQLALAGTQDDIDLFYGDVQLLNERDPKSIAAAEGVYYIAKFAHTKAGLLGKAQPVWFETFSHWAREFADRFPEQSQRAESLLFGAARSCELHSAATKDADLSTRLMTECKLCYTALAENFAASEQGQEATASLRRMSLAGQQISQFSGPTADGGFVSADEFPGKPTLIYFWESDSTEFEKDLLPLLEKIRKQLPSDRLRIVGVALDDDESTMNSFMETHSVPGQQIFFPNAEQRSWNSPLVRFWGIAKTPSVWLVDTNGKVVSTSLSHESLVLQLQKLFK